MDRDLSAVLRSEEVARLAVAPALGGVGRTRPDPAVTTGHGVVADVEATS